MKANLAIISIVLLCLFNARWNTVLCQVKVANNADLATPAAPSAILDVHSTTKGMLPPRMTAVQRNAIPSPDEGLMIYNTTDDCLNEYRAGVWKTYCELRFSTTCNCVEYLKDNGLPTQVWIPIETSDWKLLGNSGTNPTTNFLGTLDNQDISVRTNAIEKWRFRTNGTIAYHNTGGSVFLGEFAGYNDDLSNNYNTFLGLNAGHFNIFGSNNTAVGNGAAYNNITGVGNTAIGTFALHLNTAGHYNTGLGFHSLISLASGRSNVGIGYRATGYIENGDYNIGVGESACRGSVGTTTNFDHAIGIGRNTFTFKASGDYSIAIGTEACYSESTGSYNVAVGYSALSENQRGAALTAIGNNAGINTPSSAIYVNSTSLGANTIMNSSDKVRLGNATVSVVEGQVAYSWPSDARFKSNIKENVPGLDFVMGLRPVTYKFDTKKFDEFLLRDSADSTKLLAMSMNDYSKSQNIIHTGFVAQEIEALINKLNYDFDGLNAPRHDYENYSVSYSTFVVPLVKAVQEQQALIDDLKEVNNASNSKVEQFEKTVRTQQEMIDQLLKRVEQLEQDK